MRAAASGLRALVAAAAMAAGCAAAADLAIVTRDQAALRAAPRESAPVHAVLWQGEALEVRGERADYLHVWDYRRERGGFVHASSLRRTSLRPEEAPELLALVRFFRDAPGSEALGIGFAAAYIQAAPAEAVNGEPGIEVLAALATLADRLARRASSGGPQAKAEQTSAHLEVAARYGVAFRSHERDGRVRICYDGDAHRRVLAMRSSPEQRARAALALTAAECIAPNLRPPERRALDEWRAEVLDRVDAGRLPPTLKNRVLIRRAAVWSALAYQRSRSAGAKGETADVAANRALDALAGVAKGELSGDDARAYADAAMRVGASRWAAASEPAVAPGKRARLGTVPGKQGETCVVVIDPNARRNALKRCTYGVVWMASASANPEGSALAVAVQPTETWRELWIFRRSGKGWALRILPPAAAAPGVGYAELAGWLPAGRILVAREARGEGRYSKRFEVVRLDTLAVERQAGEPGALKEFRRWGDDGWRRETVSLR